MTDHHIGPDPEFERWLADAAPSLNEPPATPRDEMWAAIQARRGNAGATGARRFRREWIFPLALAAAAVTGIVIDRALVRGRTTEATRPATTIAKHDTVQVNAEPQQFASNSDPKPGPRPGPERKNGTEVEGVTTPHAPRPTPRSARSDVMRLAATHTLAQAEMVLAAYRTGDTTEARQLGRWAKDVLASTRLLLDSRAARDPQLRTLLQDLELVLAQIAQLSGAPLDPTERELLDRTLRERDLLPRIRNVVPSGGAT